MRASPRLPAEQVHAQLLHAHHAEQRIADLDVVADRDDLRLDLAVDRRNDPRLGQAASGGFGARTRRGELLAQGVALRDRVVDHVLGDEPLADELGLPLDDLLLLLEQARQAADLGLVGRAWIWKSTASISAMTSLSSPSCR